MADASGPIQSKAFTLIGALRFVEERFGPQAREKLIASLDPEGQELCRRTLLSSEWIPFGVQVQVYQQADRLFGSGDLALCRQIGRFTCETEMSTINRIFLQFASLETWIRSAGLMWRRYYSAGALAVDGFSREGGDVLVTDFDPLSPAFCEDFCGWLERTVELSGHEVVSARHVACVLDGAPACRHALRWKG